MAAVKLKLRPFFENQPGLWFMDYGLLFRGYENALSVKF
jgi:hypothetical protein